MAGVLATVVSGLFPIFIAAPIGAVLMVLTGCLLHSFRHLGYS